MVDVTVAVKNANYAISCSLSIFIRMYTHTSFSVKNYKNVHIFKNALEINL